jgi:hypothetical protein
MRVTMTSIAGSTDHPNEDFTAAGPAVAVLVDGAGISDLGGICRHGVAWYASRLTGELLGMLSFAPARPLPGVVAEAIRRVSDVHRDTCDLANPSSPMATVAILRLRLAEGRADHLLLGNSLLVLERAGRPPEIIEDRREVTIGGPYREKLEAAVTGSDEYDRAVDDFRRVLRANRNQPGGFFLAKDDPRAVDEAITGSCPITELTGAVLLSNGASRLVDKFGLADWPQFLDLLATDGPEEIIRRVRQAEASAGVIPDDATITQLAPFD